VGYSGSYSGSAVCCAKWIIDTVSAVYQGCEEMQARDG